MSKVKVFYQNHRNLILEILRFLIVGGLATIVDWLVSFTVSALLPEIKICTWSVKDSLAT